MIENQHYDDDGYDVYAEKLYKLKVFVPSLQQSAQPGR